MSALWLDAAWHAPGFVAEGAPLPFDAADRGLLLGDGAFDTALVLDGRMVWRAAHVARLVRACAALGFALDPARVEAAVGAVAPALGAGSMRITVTRGRGPRGLAPPPAPSPTLFATGAPPNPAALFAPLRLHVAAIRRNETSPLSGLKSLGYGDAVLAAAAARRAGCDEALFLNTRERVACAGTGNIVAAMDGRLVTPLLGEGAVDGIVRAALLAAPSLDAIERPLALDDLARADAVFVTNSLRLAAPVVTLDGAPLARDHAVVAQVTSVLAGSVRDAVGVDPRDLAAP